MLFISTHSAVSKSQDQDLMRSELKMTVTGKITVAGFVVCITGAALGWGIFPSIVKNKISEIKNLRPGSEGRKIWEKIPFPLTFKTYIFNVTNRAEVTQGAVPVVSEIGPYVFEEWREKVDLVDHEDNDTVSFRLKSTWIFDKEKSWPLTGQEIITVAHPLLLGIILTAEREEPATMGIVSKALEALFMDPTDIFLTSTAMDLLFDGNYLNCSSGQFSARAVCSAIRQRAMFPETSEHLFQFSFFGNRNGTKSEDVYSVRRGVEDITQVGRFVQVNGQETQNVWSGMPCNAINGTDGTVFPPFLETRDIVTFAPEICRSMVARYSGITSYKLVPTLHFTSNFGDMENHDDEKCFCPARGCLKKGVLDISKCQGAPLVVSLPHFCDAHLDYQRGVHGLRPDGVKHGISVDLEPLSGTPLRARTRIQFSIPVKPVVNVNFTANLREVLLPIFWVEQGIEISDVVVSRIKSDLLSIVNGIGIGRWVMTAGGAATAAIGAGWNYVTGPFLSKTTSK